jgi:adenine-specific DNA methylase
VLFALALDRLAEHSTSLCRWNSTGQKMQATFGRQALPIVWDFCEANPFGGSVGSWESMVDCVVKAFDAVPKNAGSVTVAQASATELSIPDDTVDVLFTDPPYYDSVPYADLSEFFYVWLRRSLISYFPELFAGELVDKTEEAIWNPSRIYPPTGKPKDKSFYEAQMRRALDEARRVVRPNGLAVIVFAHTSTEGWEALLNGLVSAGWVVTASWPVDTEMGTRMNAMGTASLASSVHLVCRPRENFAEQGSDTVGSWRDVLGALPGKMHDWLPRLAQEGVVGADAIFACLGPALEIFSRYATVEKASGEAVPLREYLEHVWAAVAHEALSLIFEGADASGLEEDARLTAMWLWTLGATAKSTSDGVAAEGDNQVELSRAMKIEGEFDNFRHED